MSIIVLGALLGLAVVPAYADPSAEWDEPFVVRLEVYTGDFGRRLTVLPDKDWLVMDERGEVHIDVVGIDQRGRPYPADRFAAYFEPSWQCRGLVEVTETHEGDRILVAGERSGDCRVDLWVPGNANLDRELLVRVGAPLREGFSRSQADWTARQLYLAILGREADSRGLVGATAEIQRGNLAEQVRAMLASNEYRVKRSGLSPAERLEDFYLGLFGREPDSRGVRAYLDMMARGRQLEVIMTLLQSEEFERRLLREAGS